MTAPPEMSPYANRPEQLVDLDRLAQTRLPVLRHVCSYLMAGDVAALLCTTHGLNAALSRLHGSFMSISTPPIPAPPRLQGRLSTGSQASFAGPSVHAPPPLGTSKRLPVLYCLNSDKALRRSIRGRGHRASYGTNAFTGIEGGAVRGRLWWLHCGGGRSWVWGGLVVAAVMLVLAVPGVMLVLEMVPSKEVGALVIAAWIMLAIGLGLLTAWWRHGVCKRGGGGCWGRWRGQGDGPPYEPVCVEKGAGVGCVDV
jgi:hypothetical protein